MIGDGPSSFKDMEREGWHRNAPHYDARAGRLTRMVVAGMLDSVRARAGMRLLDVCCGPGYGAGTAASRGLAAVGVDLAPGMVREAQRRFPEATFHQGDAEALPFSDGCFDAVICAFGLIHLPEPGKGIAEVFRVLVRGGRFAFTTWCRPDRAALLRIALEAVTVHADLTVSLPPAPSIFGFSEAAAGTDALERAGFCEVTVDEVPLALQVPTPDDVFDWLDKSTVRTMALFRLQTPDVQARIRQDILESAATFQTGGGLEVPCPAMLYAARKA